MNCIEMQSLCAIRGQTLEIDIPVVDDAGDPVDLAGFTIECGVALTQTKPYLHELPTEVLGADNNVIRATLTSSACEALKARPHYFSAWVITGDVKTPVARGTLHVQPDSRVA